MPLALAKIVHPFIVQVRELTAEVEALKAWKRARENPWYIYLNICISIVLVVKVQSIPHVQILVAKFRRESCDHIGG